MIHGLVLAGGIGSRLAADGVGTPKALTAVGGVPLARRAIDGLGAAGAEGTTTVVLQRDTAAWMRRHAADALAGATTIEVSTPTSLHSLVAGFRAIPPGPVLCTMVDTVMPETAWRRAGAALREALAAGAAAALVVAPALPDDSPLPVTADPDGRIRGFPTGTVPVGDPVTAGIYMFGPAARAHAETAVAAGVERMRGFLRSLVTHAVVTAVPVDRAVDVDHAADLALAEHWLGLSDSTLIR